MPIDAKTTKAQDDKLFALARTQGGGCAIVAQERPNGPIRVNAIDGTRWIVDARGRALEIKR